MHKILAITALIATYKQISPLRWSQVPKNHTREELSNGEETFLRKPQEIYSKMFVLQWTIFLLLKLIFQWWGNCCKEHCKNIFEIGRFAMSALFLLLGLTERLPVGDDAHSKQPQQTSGHPSQLHFLHIHHVVRPRWSWRREKQSKNK